MNNPESVCRWCGNPLELPYYENIYDDLVKQTPKSVWDEYLANGYTMREAIKEERSQA